MSTATVPPSIRPRRRRGGLYAFIVLVLILGGAWIWTWLTLSWAYADGIRAGVLQKFTHRGWICKTMEGSLAQYLVPGISPQVQVWQFSVRDPRVAAQLEKAVGRQVQLHYTEHPGVPSACFADTRFFVDQVTVTDTAPPSTPPGTPSGTAPNLAPGALPAAPSSAPPPNIPAPPVNR
jgi:hypothetical protein